MIAKQRKPGGKSAKAAKNMLVAIDFSPESRRALKHAFGLAHDFSRLILLHVIPPAATENSDKAADAFGTARTKLREFCQQPDGTVAPELIRLKVRHGTPFREILDCAKENEVEMIVIGVDESSSLGGIALGHTADRVSRYAQCPVLLVRDRNRNLPSPKGESGSKIKKG